LPGKIVEDLHCAERKHAWHVRKFRAVQMFHAKAADSNAAFLANLDIRDGRRPRQTATRPKRHAAMAGFT
jgi:hypothetical protein